MAGFFAMIKNRIYRIKNRRKMLVLYFACVIIPIIITDIYVLSALYRAEQSSREHRLENEANAIHYTFFNSVDEAARFGNTVYTSMYVYRFMHREFASEMEYYDAYNEFFSNPLVNQVNKQSGIEYKFYIDNDTITSGDQIQQIDKAEGLDWYEYMISSGRPKGLFFGGKKIFDGSVQRKMYYFQRLNYFDNSSKDIFLIEFDYTKLAQKIQNLNCESKAYICDDRRVLMTNSTYSNVNKRYASANALSDASFRVPMQVYGLELYIVVEDGGNIPIHLIYKKWYILGPLLLINILFPMYMMVQIMRVIYANKLREQEMVVAQKNAELLALHSQINPHFLFNALESIRMHSLLKQERETAEMVEKLAKLQRQYTEWQDDIISIEKELEFVGAYLELQKYRFGDRLSFDIDVSDECRKYKIPKLTLVTFVENACIHGIESKTSPGWIFVRAYREGENMLLEIEDTGNGMLGLEAIELAAKMRGASIDMLKTKGRVGIINACLRLKMMTENNVEFEVDSEQGAGTLIQMKMPTQYML